MAPNIDRLDLAALDGANGFRIVGSVFSYSGASVAGAGDVDGDGLEDLLIGAWDIHHDDGTSYVVFGSAARFAASLDLTSLDGADGFRIEGGSGIVGYSVAGAGDVNGDGIDDLIIGAPGGPYSSTAGASYVVFGSAARFGASLDLSELDGANGFRLEGINAHYADVSVDGAGDVNGDGLDDLIIGINYSGSFVVFGSSAGFAPSFDLTSLDGANGFRIDGIGTASVAGAGDVNGDGLDDLAIGVSSRSAGGQNFVVFGSSAGFEASLDLDTLDGVNGFRIEGADEDPSGFSVASAGDFNGDGTDDLLVGGVGESYVVFGSAAGFGASVDLGALDGANGLVLTGDTGDRSGFSVAGAGDFNGDGRDDLIIGARYAGESYVVFGSSSGSEASLDLADLDGANGFVLEGSGGPVAGAGDVNGDGLDDLILGAPYADPEGRENAGASYVVFGFRTDEPGAGTTAASIAAGSDDAEQSAARAQVQLRSPELEIGQGAKKLVGLRFTGLEIPEGAAITEAYIEFEAAGSDARASRIAIALQDTTSAATFGPGADAISARTYLEETTSWSPEPWVEGEVHRTADLTEALSALIGTEGLDADDALAFRFTGRGAREAAAFEGEGAAPRLVIEFDTDPPDAPAMTPLDELDGAAQDRLAAFLGDDQLLL